MAKKVSKKEVAEIITERMVKIMENNEIPWHKEWSSAFQLPRNIITRKPYRGINIFLLAFTEFKSPYWLTYKQAKQLGGCIKPEHFTKDRERHIIVFSKPMPYYIEKENETTGEKTKVKQVYYLLKYTEVWNLEQCDLGRIPEPVLREMQEQDDKKYRLQVVPEAEKAVKDYLLREQLEVEFGSTRAAYVPIKDKVIMPNAEDFISEMAYYTTFFHELTHSTGHPNRLNRKGVADFDRFGTEQYSFEELIAELGASIMAATIGINYEVTIENSAAYVKGWLRRLQSDHKFIYKAATEAQKAVDFMLNGHLN